MHGYDSRFGICYVYLGLMLGVFPVMTLGVHYVHSIENKQASNTIIYSIVAAIAVAMAVCLFEKITVKIAWVDKIGELLDGTMCDEYCLQKPLLMFIGTVIEVSITWGSLAVIKHYADIHLGLLMFFTGVLSFMMKLLYVFYIIK